jgi:hypothetical protein
VNDDGEVGGDGATQRSDAHGRGDAAGSIVRRRVRSRGPRHGSEAFFRVRIGGVLEMVLVRRWRGGAPRHPGTPGGALRRQ